MHTTEMRASFCFRRFNGLLDPDEFPIISSEYYVRVF